jgi:hypothetical protein
MPPLPPVTMATRPVRSKSFVVIDGAQTLFKNAPMVHH